VGRDARHEPGYAILLAVCTHFLPWDHQPSRFRLTPYIQELRGPDPKQRLLLCRGCASPAWAPCAGNLTGVPSFRLQRGDGGLWCWDHWKCGLKGAPESWERCSTACRACRFGAPSLLHLLCSLTHRLSQIPACLQASPGGQPVVVCALMLCLYG